MGALLATSEGSDSDFPILSAFNRQTRAKELLFDLAYQDSL